jgi:hypothetical protein
MTSSGNAPLNPNEPDGKSPDGSPDATADLRRTLNAVASGVGSRRELEQAAVTLVAHLRRERHAPEQMLLHIKQVLADAGLRPTYAAMERPDNGGESSLYRDVIAWCIRSYYDGPSSAGG